MFINSAEQMKAIAEVDIVLSTNVKIIYINSIFKCIIHLVRLILYGIKYMLFLPEKYADSSKQ